MCTAVLPRRVGTFLISRLAISFIDTAVSSTSVISDASRSRMPSRSLRLHLMGSFLLDDDAIHAVVLAEHHGHLLAAARGQVLADVVGTDGQLALAAVHQDRKPAEG